METGPAPAWTRLGGVPTPPFPHVVAAGDRLAAFLFVDPLRVRLPPSAANKILWVTGGGAAGERLTIVAERLGRPRATVRVQTFPGGQHVYRSRTLFPRAGCWRLAARWGGQRATIDARVLP